MTLPFTYIARDKSEETLELCGAPLVSQDPPLTEVSRTGILKIKTDRLDNLEGSDLFEASILF